MTIDEYLNSVIDSINSETTEEELLRISDEINQKLCEYNYYYGDSEELKTKIYSLLKDYINNVTDKVGLLYSINEESSLFFSNINSYDSTDYNGSYNGGGGGGRKKSKPKDNSIASDIVTELIVEDVDSAIPRYDQVAGLIEKTNIKSTISISEVQDDIRKLKSLLTTTKESLQKELDAVQQALLEFMQGIVGVDEEVIPVEVVADEITDDSQLAEKVEEPTAETPTVTTTVTSTFSDISKLTAAWRSKSSVKKADASFFEKAGYTVSDKGIVTIGNYKYDIKAGKLTNNLNNSSIYVDYYIPKTLIENTSKLSSANTITCLCGHSDDTISGNLGYNRNEYYSDAIIVMPSKKDLVGISESFTREIDSVIDSTTFATKFAKQQKGCHNVIGGSSSGGGSALKAAAKSDVYDTVFSINYPPLVSDVASGKGLRYERLTEEDVANLSNKTLLFIESSKDENLLYTQKGIKKLSETNSNVYFVTNGIVGDIGNAHLLDSSFWNNLAKNSGGTHSGIVNGTYVFHGSCRGLMTDVINSGIFNNNSIAV